MIKGNPHTKFIILCNKDDICIHQIFEILSFTEKCSVNHTAVKSCSFHSWASVRTLDFNIHELSIPILCLDILDDRAFCCTFLLSVVNLFPFHSLHSVLFFAHEHLTYLSVSAYHNRNWCSVISCTLDDVLWLYFSSWIWNITWKLLFCGKRLSFLNHRPYILIKNSVFASSIPLL